MEDAMKKATRFFVIPLLLIVLLASCTSTNLTTNKTGWSDYAEILSKDYEVVGHIRVEATETKTVSPLGFNTTIEGNTITYDQLIAAAMEIGADDVINVRIDVLEEGNTSPFQWLTGHTKVYTYYANGLAIRYTEPLAEGVPTLGHSKEDLPGSSFGFELPFSVPFF
ncbi:hypothetical protein L21SP2_2693 [Salinispira pacifica]|uniref:Lipoprotein n=2 Tax=Salinispira pacifica TaxID=1307761 RepID=V5WK91_9SPIO|nr:hypothetical protein L21SP2_2693 [Salinispira pacifica]